MSIEAMKQAFEVPLVEQLESVPTNARLVIDDAGGMGTCYIPVGRMCHDASKALRQAISEAEKQEPVAWQWLTTAHFRKKLPKDAEKGAWNPLYTTPQQRKPLTDEMEKQAQRHLGPHRRSAFRDGWRSAEAAHGIKE